MCRTIYWICLLSLAGVGYSQTTTFLRGTGGITCVDATASTTTYTCPTPSPQPTAYFAGLMITFIPNTTNTTTTPTVNVKGMGAKNLKVTAGISLAVGSLVGGQPYLFVYDGTRFIEITSNTSAPIWTATTAVVTPVVAPPSDSTTALKLTKADQATAVVTLDTTNSRVGVGKTPVQALDVTGTVAASTSVITPIVAPVTDGTAALKVTKADGSTAQVTLDTTNAKIGFFTAPTSTGFLHMLAASSAGADTAQAGLFEGPTQGILGLKVTGGNLFTMRYDQTNYTLRNNGSDQAVLNSNGFQIGPNALRFATTVGTTADAGVSRNGASIVCVGNGTANDCTGTIKGATLTVSNPVTEANGGTGSNITTGAAGHVLRSNATHYVDSAIQAADLPASPLTTGTTITLSAPRGYAVCTGTCTITLPVPAAGYEFCVYNDDNVATAITLAALGSSAMYENSARTAYGTAGTGTLVVAAAGANKVCVLGRDATHYLTVSTSGGAVTVN